MIRAATTLADPCTGAPRRDFLLGLRRGQLAGAHVPSWCSRHGVDAGCSQRAGPPGELTTCGYQTPAEGTGWTPPDGPGSSGRRNTLRGGCDGHSEAAFGSVRARRLAL